FLLGGAPPILTCFPRLFLLPFLSPPQFFLGGICSATMLCSSCPSRIPCICCLQVAIHRTICTCNRDTIRVPLPPSIQICLGCVAPQVVRVSPCIRQTCS